MPRGAALVVRVLLGAEDDGLSTCCSKRERGVVAFRIVESRSRVVCGSARVVLRISRFSCDRCFLFCRAYILYRTLHYLVYTTRLKESMHVSNCYLRSYTRRRGREHRAPPSLQAYLPYLPHLPYAALAGRVSNCYCRSYVATGDVAVSTAGPLVQGLTGTRYLYGGGARGWVCLPASTS